MSSDIDWVQVFVKIPKIAKIPKIKSWLSNTHNNIYLNTKKKKNPKVPEIIKKAPKFEKMEILPYN